MASFGAVLDTCVLYPSLLRDILLTVAEAEFYRPYWSDDILEELQRNLLQDGKETVPVSRLVSAMNNYFPDALIARERYQELVPVMKNQEKDRHVLAAAITAKVEIIVSNNLKDFPKEATAPYNIEIQSPDTFLLNQYNLKPFEMFTAIENWLSSSQKPRDFEQVIAQLSKTVPLTAQALRDFKD